MPIKMLPQKKKMNFLLGKIPSVTVLCFWPEQDDGEGHRSEKMTLCQEQMQIKVAHSNDATSDFRNMCVPFSALFTEGVVKGISISDEERHLLTVLRYTFQEELKLVRELITVTTYRRYFPRLTKEDLSPGYRKNKVYVLPDEERLSDESPLLLIRREYDKKEDRVCFNLVMVTAGHPLAQVLDLRQNQPSIKVKFKKGKFTKPLSVNECHLIEYLTTNLLSSPNSK